MTKDAKREHCLVLQVAYNLTSSPRTQRYTLLQQLTMRLELPKNSDFEVVFTDGWSQQDFEEYDAEWKQRHQDKRFFMHALAPSPFHWHFQQASEALQNDLYLPGLSGLLNGIEASLRTVCCRLQGVPLDGDLGRVMSNGLLKQANEYGMRVEKLSFPGEENFLDTVQNTRNPVEIVRLRNDVCHGNFQAYVLDLPDIGEFFTPECLREVSAHLLEISYEWTLEVSRFMVEQGWRDPGKVIEKPQNPLGIWLHQGTYNEP